MNDPVFVTKTFMPPRAEYDALVDAIWASRQLTNQGPLLRKFEDNVKERLCVENFHFVANGTVALQLAIRALDIEKGEIITTPFSYVATTSAILWENLKPVFVDIDPITYCIDPAKIEAAITPNTKAILAVHVFGNPCDVDAIDNIGKKHNLKVIYDGAHAFGVSLKGKSLLSYGDVSICSFHSTKILHTIEGGAVITPHDGVSGRVELLKRFGHNQDDHIMLGINAKASEFNAAMGLCNLKYIDDIISSRKKHVGYYISELKLSVREQRQDVTPNYSYMHVLCKSETDLSEMMEELVEKNIHARRYFFPSLNLLPYVPQTYSCPVSEDIASRIVCLPLWHDMKRSEIKRVIRVVEKYNVA